MIYSPDSNPVIVLAAAAATIVLSGCKVNETWELASKDPGAYREGVEKETAQASRLIGASDLERCRKVIETPTASEQLTGISRKVVGDFAVALKMSCFAQGNASIFRDSNRTAIVYQALVSQQHSWVGKTKDVPGTCVITIVDGKVANIDRATEFEYAHVQNKCHYL